ncbi:uncharacterized protein LOC123699864 [Colias croceus]|uniref:uncharacterized protein LOC123699864 n=1 Tax=Colias crocea TaxID=72248 RepID=UPI001E280710|nr:uncharacterized protein LOC123699864 [Colias croceus]
MEMQEQTKNIMCRIDEKLGPVLQEITNLKMENQNLKAKIDYLEREKRQKNIIAFGIKEDETSSMDLLKTTINLLTSGTAIDLTPSDINKVYRLGKKNLQSDKPRPVLISFLSLWQKEQVIQSKKKIKNVYIVEDYPKDILDKRKLLQQQLIEEREKGRYAVIKYDKLIVRDNKNKNENRKRNRSESPNKNIPDNKQKLTEISKSHRKNAFDIMRVRSNSLSTIPSSAKN